MLYDAIISGIRTGVAVLVGFVITWLINQGVVLPENIEYQVNFVLFTLLVGAYNALVNWLAKKYNPNFGYLLGVKKTPVYDKPEGK